MCRRGAYNVDVTRAGNDGGECGLCHSVYKGCPITYATHIFLDISLCSNATLLQLCALYGYRDKILSFVLYTATCKRD